MGFCHPPVCRRTRNGPEADPVSHDSDAAAHAAAQRAYRQRKKAEQVRRNDDLANGAAA